MRNWTADGRAEIDSRVRPCALWAIRSARCPLWLANPLLRLGL